MIGVLGATGTLGTPLMAALHRDATPVRALAHRPEAADGLRDTNVDVIVGDIHNPADIAKFLDGISTLFLLTPPARNQTEVQNNIIDAAVAAKLDSVVKLSVYTAADDALCAFSRLHQANDRYIAQSGLPYTILHPHTFMQSMALQFAAGIRATGMISAAVRPEATLTMVDVRDVAEVAAAILTKGVHNGETILITGPEELSYPDCAKLIGNAIGKNVGYEQLPFHQVQEYFIDAGMDEWFAEAVVALHRMYDTGQLNPITDAVQRFTGKPARSFEQFLNDNAALFQ